MTTVRQLVKLIELFTRRAIVHDYAPDIGNPGRVDVWVPWYAVDEVQQMLEMSLPLAIKVHVKPMSLWETLTRWSIKLTCIPPLPPQHPNCRCVMQRIDHE